MTSVYLAQQVREIDRIAIEEAAIPGLLLMRRAAEACVDVLQETWPAPRKVGVLCGSGNNAGDGFIVAGLLQQRGFEVTVGLLGRTPTNGTDAGKALEFCRQAGVPIGTADQALAHAELIVDALLGTGVKGSVRPEYQQVIEAVNQSGCPVLSVDLPSGLCADTGNVLGACIRADTTVTFIGRKLGLLTNDGPEYVGRLRFADLSVPDAVFVKVKPVASMLDYASLIAQLPARHRNAHKMNHGHLLIVGGAEGMAGAVTMAAEAAMFAGAGMVSVATHSSGIPSLIARRPEVMAKAVKSKEELIPMLARASALVIGPGLGSSSWGREMFDAAMASMIPTLVDADGLNLLAQQPQSRENWILTPHPGEAKRLIGKDIQQDRLASVQGLQEQYGGQVLLKGAGTLIAGPDGVSLCPYGNPGMSVAGMGDVLSGVIGGLLAQGVDSSLAARLGAVVHSLAADDLVAIQGEKGLLATELLVGIRQLLNGQRP